MNSSTEVVVSLCNEERCVNQSCYGVSCDEVDFFTKLISVELIAHLILKLDCSLSTHLCVSEYIQEYLIACHKCIQVHACTCMSMSLKLLLPCSFLIL